MASISQQSPEKLWQPHSGVLAGKYLEGAIYAVSVDVYAIWRDKPTSFVRYDFGDLARVSPIHIKPKAEVRKWLLAREFGVVACSSIAGMSGVVVQATPFGRQVLEVFRKHLS